MQVWDADAAAVDADSTIWRFTPKSWDEHLNADTHFEFKFQGRQWEDYEVSKKNYLKNKNIFYINNLKISDRTYLENRFLLSRWSWKRRANNNREYNSDNTNNNDKRKLKLQSCFINYISFSEWTNCNARSRRNYNNKPELIMLWPVWRARWTGTIDRRFQKRKLRKIRYQ